MDAEQLASERKKLNEHCMAVNGPIGETGETPCSTYGRLLDAQGDLKGLDLPVLRLEASEWSATDSLKRGQLVAQLQDRLTRCGVPTKHPFWGSKLTVLLPTDRDSMAASMRAALKSTTRLREASARLGEVFGAPAVESAAGAELLAESAEFVTKAPDLTDLDFTSRGWLAHDLEVARILGAGRENRSLRQKFETRLRPEAWDCDVLDLRRTVSDLCSRWWRLFSGRWREANSRVAELCAGAAPKAGAVMLELLDAIIGASQCSKAVESADPVMRPLLGPSWRGLASDWDLLEKQAAWIIEGQRRVQAGTLADWCVGPEIRSVDRNQVVLSASEVRARVIDFMRDLQTWSSLLEYMPAEHETPSRRTFAGLEQLWTLQLSSLERLHALVGFNQIASECEKQGLKVVVELAREWEHGPRKLVSLFERARLSSVLERVFLERPALAGFDGSDHSKTVDEFRRLDVLQLETNRARLAEQHSQSMPTGGGSGEVAVLWREFEKKRRHLPIRKLIESAGHVIQVIKPVFMMSPLSIANYIPPGCLTFDLVVFDEASQVRPVDALGAVVRGKQVVVVGDNRQLPPTSFFDSLVSQEESADEDEDQPPTSDIESILGLFSARGAQQRMLRWHYRSRHESLIAVSNHLFYRDGLVVFPSPSRDRKSLGLVYRRLKNAYYDRGRTKTNPEEARAVAAAVMEHARMQMRSPKTQRETLGVAAFSAAQMDAILKQVELVRRKDPSCEEFFGYPPHEPFFVKNLENVQGDERDVIFISIGYARAAAEGLLPMNFGPLNRDGGERRLNVLISRARKRCEVFTALAADDIDLSRSNAAGVAALKVFLHYAETGSIEVSTPTGRPPDSEFEEQVLRQLTALGHTVQPQVGCAGFFLDLAVVDPRNPGRYLLGIECDGARYHSALSARDRDRLRQNVLEGLGWRIHRIWSTDWFHDPEGELRKVVRAIEAAEVADPMQLTPKSPATSSIPESELKESLIWGAAKAEASRTTPYQCADVPVSLGSLEIHETNRDHLADLLARVVAVEGPVHWSEAARRVMLGAGVQRMGNRIEAAFREAMGRGVTRRLFHRRGEFLWQPGMKEPVVRDRTNLPTASRRLEMVAPEEIRKAILLVVEEAYGMPPAEVPIAVCRKLGFGHVTEDMRNCVEPHRDALVDDGALQLSGFNLTVASQQGP